MKTPDENKDEADPDVPASDAVDVGSQESGTNSLGDQVHDTSLPLDNSNNTDSGDLRKTLDETLGNPDWSIGMTTDQDGSFGTDDHPTVGRGTKPFPISDDDSDIRLTEITQLLGNNSPSLEQDRSGGTHLYSELEEKHSDSDTPASPSRPAKVIRDKIPGFQILEELGRGAFGIVFRARDIQLDREVAIKIPLLQDHKLAERYLAEARNAAKIDAVGIVPVYQVGETRAGNPFVVQKLIEGSTLSTVLRRSKTLPATWSIDTVRKIALAIGEAHLAGLVHRDLKPANILIDRSGEPWVADFGLAVFEEEQRELKGEIAGTPLYMAPEQLTGRADWLDGRADIWALGVIFYEMLSGRPPFHADNFRDLKEEILRREPKPLSQRNPNLPHELDDVFRLCCAKKIGERVASAGELASHLAHVLTECDLPLEEIVLSSEPDGKTTIRSRAITNTQVRQSMFGRATVVQPRSKPMPASNRWLGVAIAAIAATATVCFVGLGLVWNRLNQTSIPTSTSTGELLASTPPNSTPISDLDPSLPSGLAANDALSDGDQQNTLIRSAPLSNHDADGVRSMPGVANAIELVVSESVENGFSNLASAIEAAQPGDTITVMPGTYQARATIEKEVQIVGHGSRDEVQIIGDDQFALEIKNNSHVTLTNLSLIAEGKNTSAIELLSGHVDLKACKLSSTSFDCLKAHEGTSFSAAGCRFESEKHPAIVGDGDCELTLQNCDFRFDVLNQGVEREDPVVAIQLTNAHGSIRECTFTGTGETGKGISVAQTNKELLIANCEFTSLKHAVELFDCSQIRLTSRNEFSECELGIYAENSDGEVVDAAFNHCSWPISLVQESQFSFRNVQVQQAENVGLWIDNSRAKLAGCEFVGNEKTSIGVFVDVEDPREDQNAVDLQSESTVALSAFDSTFADNQIGVLLVAGNVEMDGGLVTGNRGAGIAAVGYTHLKEALQRRPESNRNSRSLKATNLTANAYNDAPAVFFMTTGSYSLEDCVITDLKSQHRPALGMGLTTQPSGPLVKVITR